MRVEIEENKSSTDSSFTNDRKLNLTRLDTGPISSCWRLGRGNDMVGQGHYDSWAGAVRE